MKARAAFTLIELLLAMVLASFVVLGMMQLYQGVVRYLEYARSTLSINRQVGLLFGQMTRDFSSAYIPDLAKPIKDKPEKTAESANDQKPQDAQTPDQKKKEAEQEKEQRRKFFIGTINDRADRVKVDEKQSEPIKMISFICTNPLQVYGDKRARLVRVVYELVVDKANSARDTVSYQLVRKETNDLRNVEGKVDEFAPHRAQPVQRTVIAEGIKSLVVEYLTKRKPKKEETQKEKREESQDLKSFRWGHDHQEMQGVVPQKMMVWLDIWDDKKVKSTQFSTLITIFSYPTPAKDEEEPKQERKAEQSQKSADTQLQSQGADVIALQGAAL